MGMRKYDFREINSHRKVGQGEVPPVRCKFRTAAVIFALTLLILERNKQR
jgi:hypothetical protein